MPDALLIWFADDGCVQLVCAGASRQVLLA
jgi:hypothetical protein